MAETPTYIVRPATETDSPQINDIVNYEVMHSVSNFNYGQRSLEDGLAWFRTTIAGGYPILVATTVVDGQEVVAGYASLGVFRAKDGFRLYVITLSILHGFPGEKSKIAVQNTSQIHS